MKAPQHAHHLSAMESPLPPQPPISPRHRHKSAADMPPVATLSTTGHQRKEVVIPDKNKFCYPVSRIGNAKNPKLIILLCNPGGSTEYYKMLGEYVMDKDHKYSAKEMKFKYSRQYIQWWNEILQITDKYKVKDSEILALEYYPYHTRKFDERESNDIPKSRKKFVQESLKENTEILKQGIENKIPIFGYYHGCWTKHFPDLSDYEKLYKCKERWKSSKLKELETFLKEHFKQPKS
jgi:hypothetical protein